MIISNRASLRIPRLTLAEGQKVSRVYEESFTYRVTRLHLKSLETIRKLTRVGRLTRGMFTRENSKPPDSNLVPRVFVPLDQRSENESSEATI